MFGSFLDEILGDFIISQIYYKIIAFVPYPKGKG